MNLKQLKVTLRGSVVALLWLSVATPAGRGRNPPGSLNVLMRRPTEQFFQRQWKSFPVGAKTWSGMRLFC